MRNVSSAFARVGDHRAGTESAATDPKLRDRLDAPFAAAPDRSPADRLAFLRSHSVSPRMLHAVPNMFDITLETRMVASHSSDDEGAPDALADLQIGGRIGNFSVAIGFDLRRLGD